MKICYANRRFGEEARSIIDRANAICQEYQAQGFDLTLRQLFYQFVARGIIPNRQSEYKRLGNIINDARLAGMLDWNYIVDRTRNVQTVAHWTNPAAIIEAAASSHRLDKWANQPRRVEVWIEKDALSGVIDGVCRTNDVSYFSCRGYTSQSEMWSAAQRLRRYARAGQEPTILHFGDHDPSGMDMTRDITDRLTMFMGGIEVNRLALNMDQVRQYSPPPNPAKLTDSRASSYVDLYGDDSWELDALEPQVLAALISDTIDTLRDDDLWQEMVEQESRERELLTLCSDRWDDVLALLDEDTV